jgi:phage gpG-like protein
MATRYLSGLIITPSLLQRQVKVTLNFEPSVGIMARKIDKLGLDIRSFREPLKESIQKVMIPSIRRNFEAGGRPRWMGLAPITVKKRGSAKPVLIRSGALKRGATTLGIWTIDTEKAMILDLPDNIWYGKVHQAGYGGGEFEEVFHYPQGHHGPAVPTGETIGGDGAIPARPFIVVQQGDITKINMVFDRWLGRRIRAAGLK